MNLLGRNALWLMGPGAIYIVIVGMAIMDYHG